MPSVRLPHTEVARVAREGPSADEQADARARREPVGDQVELDDGPPVHLRVGAARKASVTLWERPSGSTSLIRTHRSALGPSLRCATATPRDPDHIERFGQRKCGEGERVGAARRSESSRYPASGASSRPPSVGVGSLGSYVKPTAPAEEDGRRSVSTPPGAR